MNEEAVKYAFDLFVRDGYKGDISKFQKLLATNQEALDYSFTLFERDGYKGGKDKYKVLMGLGETAAPVATAEPITTEPTKTEVVAEEPVKELSNKPLETVKAQGIPQREAEMPTADTTKMPPMVVREVKPEVKEEPKKEMPIGENLMPITEKTEVKAVETPSDKMVIKSEKKEEAKKDEWECPPGEKGCSKNEDVVSKYIDKTYHKNKKDYAFIADREGNLASFIDDGGRGKSMAEVYKDENYNHDKKGFMYAAEELPKSKRFSTYSVPVNGVETSIVYDNKTGIILKDTGDVITNKQGNQVKTWLDVPTNNPEYEVLKAEIDKAKGGTTAPKVSTVPTLEPWQQPQGNIQVKEVTEQPKMEVKEVTKEEPKGIPSYDDLGINPEKDPGSFLGANKNVKFEKLSPDEIIEKGYLKGIGSDIKLERNKSLRYPDPPGTVFKKEKIGEREVYSSYDKANDKWYIYDEKSNKDNWTEVKSGPIKTLLNSKYKENNKTIDSKTDYNSEEEEKEMTSMRRSIMLNKYLPYVMKNWDSFSNEQQTKIKEDLNTGGLNILMRKYIERNDPNLDFWLDVNDKIFKNQATSSNAIDVYGEGSENIYPSKLIEIPTLKKDVDEGRIKLLRSIAGDIFYDEKNDVFYYGEAFNREDLKRTKDMYSEGGGIYKERTSQTYVKILPKGTPAYDKIKSSLSKYNK
jgi:hypothetical protein